ncbi:MAG: hypothetical protein GEV03_18450 [Streptosporangiales bacterium]|nr:hypothetical protein [Streptosporangiales bacterium]
MEVRHGKWAVVDESMRSGERLYVLAAAIVDADLADAHRKVLRALLPKGQRRLHWRDEREKRREQLAVTCGGLDLGIVVVMGTGMVPSRQERARRRCAERLLWWLTDYGVEQVIFETRGPHADAQDQRLVAALQGHPSFPHPVPVTWTSPWQEPLLWLADIAAGTAVLAELGDDRYLKLLGDTIEIDRFVAS